MKYFQSKDRLMALFAKNNTTQIITLDKHSSLLVDEEKGL
jgi:hypothetical protein